jgi:hypothetical protein
MKIRRWVTEGAIKYIHFGTPCANYSAARNGSDGGPRALRSLAHINGLPDLDPREQLQCDEGTKFMLVTAELIKLNPSLMWSIQTLPQA